MLKLKFRDQPGSIVKLSVATVTLGRDEGNDVVIDSPSVSDFHAEITTDAQSPLIVDLLSANGTFVNERRISGRCQLQAWDVIRLGTVELEVTDPNTHRPQDWALRTESDLLASQFHVLQTRTVVGRDPACDLTIDSNLLSRRHAELIIEDDHLKVIDLDSANGTFLNGEEIEEADAWPGDELRFDKQSFIVIGPSPPKASPSESSEDRTMVRGLPGEETVIAGPAEENDAVTALDATDLDGDTALMASEETLLFVAPPPIAVLSEIGTGDEQRSIALENDTQRIGRSDDCDIVLADKSVSKLHAEFAFEHGGWIVRDLGSSNGVLVNGERIENVELQTGDRVQLGRLQFDFSIAGEIIEEREPVTMIFQPAAQAAGRDRGLSAREKSTKSGVYFWLLGLGGVVAGAAALWFLNR